MRDLIRLFLTALGVALGCYFLSTCQPRPVADPSTPVARHIDECPRCAAVVLEAGVNTEPLWACPVMATIANDQLQRLMPAK